MPIAEDETAVTLENEYALSEEEEAPPYAYEVPANTPVHRRLRAIAGAGNAYIFLVLPADGSQVSLDFWGITPEDLGHVLHQVAEATTA